MEKIFHANSNLKRTEMTILRLDKTDFKIKIITKYREQYIIIFKSQCIKKIIIIKIFAPNRTPKYMNQKLTKLKEKWIVQQ